MSRVIVHCIGNTGVIQAGSCFKRNIIFLLSTSNLSLKKMNKKLKILYKKSNIDKLFYIYKIFISFSNNLGVLLLILNKNTDLMDLILNFVEH